MSKKEYKNLLKQRANLLSVEEARTKLVKNYSNDLEQLKNKIINKSKFYKKASFTEKEISEILKNDIQEQEKIRNTINKLNENKEEINSELSKIDIISNISNPKKSKVTNEGNERGEQIKESELLSNIFIKKFKKVFNPVISILTKINKRVKGLSSWFISDFILGLGKKIVGGVASLGAGLFGGLTGAKGGLLLSGKTLGILAGIGGIISRGLQVLQYANNPKLSWQQKIGYSLAGNENGGLQGALQGGLQGQMIGSLGGLPGMAIGGAIGAALGAIGGKKISKFMDDFEKQVIEGWQKLKRKGIEVWNNIQAWAKSLWSSIKFQGTSIWSGIKTQGIGIWSGIKTQGIGIWNGIKGQGIGIWSGIKGQGLQIWTAIKTQGIGIWTVIKTQGIGIWNGIQTQGLQIWTAIKTQGTGIWTAIKTQGIDIWNGIKNQGLQIWSVIQKQGTNIWNTIKTQGIGIWNGIKSQGLQIWTIIKTQGTNIWKDIKGQGTQIWTVIQKQGTNIWSDIQTQGTNIWTGIKDQGMSIWNGIKDQGIQIWNPIKKVIMQIYTPFQKAGKNIQDFTGSTYNKITKFIGGIQDFFTGSQKPSNVPGKKNSFGIPIQTNPLLNITEPVTPTYHFAHGGLVKPDYSTDTISAKLSPNEYVMTQGLVKSNPELINLLNAQKSNPFNLITFIFKPAINQLSSLPKITKTQLSKQANDITSSIDKNYIKPTRNIFSTLFADLKKQASSKKFTQDISSYFSEISKSLQNNYSTIKNDIINLLGKPAQQGFQALEKFTTPFITNISKMQGPALDKVQSGLGGLLSSIQPTLGPIQTSISQALPLVQTLWSSIKSTPLGKQITKDIIEPISQFFSSIGKLFTNIISGPIGKIAAVGFNIISTPIKVLIDALTFIVDGINNIGNLIINNPIIKGINIIVNSVTNAAKGIVNFIKNIFNFLNPLNAIKGIGNVVGGVVNGIGNFFGNIGKAIFGGNNQNTVPNTTIQSTKPSINNTSLMSLSNQRIKVQQPSKNNDMEKLLQSILGIKDTLGKTINQTNKNNNNNNTLINSQQQNNIVHNNSLSDLLGAMRV